MYISELSFALILALIFVVLLFLLLLPLPLPSGANPYFILEGMIFDISILEGMIMIKGGRYNFGRFSAPTPSLILYAIIRIYYIRNLY